MMPNVYTNTTILVLTYYVQKSNFKFSTGKRGETPNILSQNSDFCKKFALFYLVFTILTL